MTWRRRIRLGLEQLVESARIEDAKDNAETGLCHGPCCGTPIKATIEPSLWGNALNERLIHYERRRHRYHHDQQPAGESISRASGRISGSYRSDQ